MPAVSFVKYGRQKRDKAGNKAGHKAPEAFPVARGPFQGHSGNAEGQSHDDRGPGRKGKGSQSGEKAQVEGLPPPVAFCPAFQKTGQEVKTTAGPTGDPAPLVADAPDEKGPIAEGQQASADQRKGSGKKLSGGESTRRDGEGGGDGRGEPKAEQGPASQLQQEGGSPYGQGRRLSRSIKERPIPMAAEFQGGGPV